MKDDKLLERNIKNLLKILIEQEQKPGTAVPVISGAAPTSQQPLTKVTTTPIEPKEEPAVPSEISRSEPAQKIQYYSTKDLFTTDYPPNSREWVNELKQKPWMIPLQDGRIAQKLAKLFPTFSPSGSHGAARYNDYQFRVILRGDLKAETNIKVTAKTGSNEVNAELTFIKIPNNANLTDTGSNPKFIKSPEKKNIITLEIPTEELMQWATGKKYEPPEPTEKPVEEKPKEKEVPEITSSKTHPYYEDFIDIATGETMSMRKKDAEKFVSWLIQNRKPEKKDLSDDKKIQITLNAYNEYKKTNKPKTETVNLELYLRSLLLEKREQKKELPTEKGGRIVAELNDKLFKEWFQRKGVGIAASVYNRFFEGNVFEWFAVQKANFSPKTRDMKTEDDTVEINLNGDLVMEVEIWIDARVGENKGINNWTFRVWDKAAPIAKASFQIPVLGARAMRPKQ